MKIAFLGLGLGLRKFIKEMKESGTLSASCTFFSYEEFDQNTENIEKNSEVFVFCIDSIFFAKKDFYFTYIKKYSSKLRKEVLLFTEDKDTYKELVFQALQKGAVDFVKLPEKLDLFSKKNFQQKFQEVFHYLEGHRKNGTDSRKENLSESIDDLLLKNISDPVICIGVSTGGPKILSELFSEVPANFSYPVIIAQHMPSNYTKGFIEFMKNSYDLNFVEITNGEKIENGVIYVVPGGQHVSITERKRFKFEKEETIASAYRPSIDLLFSSAGNVFMESCVAILLTGIGEDGVNGLKKIKSYGGTTVVQDEATSVVFGMPQAAIREKVVDKVLPIALISKLLNKLI